MPTATINQVQNAQPNAPAVQAAQNTSGPDAPSAMPISFGRAGKRAIRLGQTQNVASADWASGYTQTFDIPTFGYLSGWVLTVLGTGGVNGTKTVAVNADAPWNLFSNIQYTDVNGTPLMSLDGYAFYLTRLLGGFFRSRPDQSTFGYSAPSVGAAGTGNFTAKFECMGEFGTDGLGCLPNMDSGAQYHIDLTYADPTKFFTTTPGTVPGLSVVNELYARTRPPAMDKSGRAQATQPPAAGTAQYWMSQTANVLEGDNTIQIKRTGNIIRNHYLIFRDSSGSRSSADSTGVTPTTIQFNYDAGIKYRARVDTLRQLDYEYYNFDVPAGVIALPYTTDPDGIPGHEYGDEYLATTGSTLLELQFTSSAAGTLQIITNDIVAVSPDMYSAAAMNVAGA